MVHLMISGPSGVGKTTCAKAMIYAKLQNNYQILVLDPHASRNTWQGAKTIGCGRDYDAINAELIKLYDILNMRFNQLSKTPNARFKKLCIVIDEVPSIVANCSAYKHVITAIAREGRKVEMCLMIITQSTRVRALGITGQGDIVDSFAQYTLTGIGKATYKALGLAEKPVNTSEWLTLSTLWDIQIESATVAYIKQTFKNVFMLMWFLPVSMVAMGLSILVQGI